MESPEQQVTKPEAMFKLYWQGKPIDTIIEGASEDEVKEFAKIIVSEKNENYAINLIKNLLEDRRK